MAAPNIDPAPPSCSEVPHSQPGTTFAEKVKAKLKAAVTAGLYGLRLATSVCLTLYISFCLELESPYWAGQTALPVSQKALTSRQNS